MIANKGKMQAAIIRPKELCYVCGNQDKGVSVPVMSDNFHLGVKEYNNVCRCAFEWVSETPVFKVVEVR